MYKFYSWCRFKLTYCAGWNLLQGKGLNVKEIFHLLNILMRCRVAHAGSTDHLPMVSKSKFILVWALINQLFPDGL